MKQNIYYLEKILAKALDALPIEQRTEMNVFKQKITKIMADTDKPVQERTAEIMKLNQEMQLKYVDNSRK